jgi:soluble lytic murein transglycosylase
MSTISAELPLACRPLLVAWTALAVFGLAGSAFAQLPLYRYVDEDGVTHFTNVPSDRRFHRVYVGPHGGLLMASPSRPGAPPSDHRYDLLIARVAAAYQLEPALVKAVIAAESNFEPRAVSRKGAQGLMQLMPRTSRALGVVDPLQADDNVLGGTRYLRLMVDRYDNLSNALAAYNAGPSAVDRYRGIPPFAETQDYVARVLHYYHGYHRDFSR